MKVEILKPIVGTGDFVEGYRDRFWLEAGQQVEVADAQALRWIEGGIAQPVAAAAPESAMMAGRRGRRRPARGV